MQSFVYFFVNDGVAQTIYTEIVYFKYWTGQIRLPLNLSVKTKEPRYNFKNIHTFALHVHIATS